MKPFKFFQTEIQSTLDNIHPGETYSTASFADTPEGHMARRRYYHTNMNPYNGRSNNEMEQYFFDRYSQRQAHEEVTRRINGGNNNYTPFFTGTPIATRVNPKWWMKIKIFFQEAWVLNEIPGVIVLGFTLTITTIAIISKILNVW